MNKKVLRAALMAAVVAVAGYGVYANQESEIKLSDVALENVEALAGKEGDDHLYRTTDRIEVQQIDPDTGEIRTIITILCDGYGLLECA